MSDSCENCETYRQAIREAAAAINDLTNASRRADRVLDKLLEAIESIYVSPHERITQTDLGDTERPPAPKAGDSVAPIAIPTVTVGDEIIMRPIGAEL